MDIKINRRHIQNKANEFLVKYKRNKLPINAYLLAIAHRCCLVPYSHIDRRLRMNGNILDLPSIYGNGLDYYSVERGIYIIGFNNKCSVQEINWAVAHELGHIILEHLDTENNVLNYKSVRTYRVSGHTVQHETEAAYCAESILCPDAVLEASRILNPEEIIEMCLVPKHRAIIKSEQVKLSLFTRIYDDDPLAQQLVANFKDFIKLHLNREEISEELCYLPIAE